MPPSPSPSPLLRCSPGRKLRIESTHKRGRSLESGLPLKAKDDDLVLFNEMQNRERDNFLLHPSDDFEDSISKLKYFSEFKLGITIPPRGQSSDLLNADGEKNDYDWLLTPPDTPLFSSLDDDEPQPINLSRGRARSQPISISRSCLSEKTPMTNRSSFSPRRLSPSPRSSYNATQPRARPSSASRSSPPPARPVTPSRRPSTAPTKPLTPTPRSSTPPVRRMSTGASGPALSSGRRGASPVKANCGKSASPKLQGWQSDLPGFSTDAPPNLRTSLSDRSSSRVRGFSPASVNGRDSSSKFRRQSVSPSASGSVSSSHIHERDTFTSYSKASAVSSGDDEADSVQSSTAAMSDYPIVRKYGAFANSRAIAISKMPSKMQSATPAPQRSFDSILRQMDQRKAPQNMFRPLLSSVPATTFYVGKANSGHRPLFSRNSSLTTSSNASSDHGASVPLDIGDSDLDHRNLTGEWEKAKDLENQEEVFEFDKLDEISEDICNDNHAGRLQSGIQSTSESRTNEVCFPQVVNSLGKIADIMDMEASQSLFTAQNLNIDYRKIVGICSRCGKDYLNTDVYKEEDICQECDAAEQLSISDEALTTLDIIQNDGALGRKVHLQSDLLEQLEDNNSVVTLRHHESIEQGTDFCPDVRSPLLMDAISLHHCEQESNNPDIFGASETRDGCKSSQLEMSASPGFRVDNPEGAGISVLLLQRSSSINCPVVQGRALSAVNLLCSEPSYARNDSVSNCSFGPESSSASSSVDMGPSKLTESHNLCQLGTKMIEIDIVRNSSSIHAHAMDSLSETCSVARGPFLDMKLDSAKLSCVTVASVENETVQESSLDIEHDSSYEETQARVCADTSIEQVGMGDDTTVCSDTSITSSTSYMQLSSQLSNLQFHDISIADNSHNDDCFSYEKSNENFQQSVEGSIPDIKMLTTTPDSCFIEEIQIPADNEFWNEISDVATHNSSVMNLEKQNNHENAEDMQTESTIVQRPKSMDDSQENCVLATSDKDVVISASDTIAEHSPNEGPNAAVEAPRKSLQRSFTLEEATNIVLFCSSVVHDIAYSAATIGMERELSSVEKPPHPTISILGNRVSDQKDLRKRVQTSRKVKRKRLETETKMTSLETDNYVNHPEVAVPITGVSGTVDSTKPPKLESKCNCTVM